METKLVAAAWIPTFWDLQSLGAEFKFDADLNVYFVEARQLRGTYILMDEISVTGTANVLMAAVLAKGTTTIYNAACEPYVQQLCKLLNRMGARISGVSSNMLIIEGVESIGWCRTPPPARYDRSG